ncbi:MAG: FAD-dependent oxidoreductase [Candidatus Limnocylindrales bacterium]|jgi:NADPH-dependent glutamate synthase beta subunit-like oxidoreductase/Pyruvate/2-oxoacid:ferredoxin oxidoreductase delta subunit
MGYRIQIENGNCLNCGVCMDVCPVQALDMSRPQRPGVEGSGVFGKPFDWMMEYPVQVGECVGCGICVRECPTHVVMLDTVAGPTPLAARQGPVSRPVEPAPAWQPLGEVTRESLKPARVSPWGSLFAWRTSERPNDWQVWRSMVTDSRRDPIAPCQEACPAGTDAGRYVGLIGQGRYDEAYAVAAEVNPFPSVCGWICTAPCEAVCRRGTLDEPIAIRRLKRFAAEQGKLPPVAPPAEKRKERVAIVGGGPAGMSAAYYLARLGYGVTVLEAMPVPGGMMAIGIPEYRLPRTVLRQEIDRIVGLGVELKLDSAMGRDFTLAELEAKYDAIFLATGASRSRKLGVPGDDLPGVVPATFFLKQVNLGEKPVLRGSVVVVGGGSTAMDAARSALRSGASSVTVLYRRGRGEMPAQAEEVEAAEHEGVHVQFEAAVSEVVGSARGVSAVKFVSQRPTGKFDGGRAVYEPIPGSEREKSATTVLVAVGEEPDPSILPEGAGIETSGFSGIVADAGQATGRKGVFAGGDVVSGAKTIIHAVGAGRRAAGSIHEYLSGSRDGEAEIMATVRVPKGPESVLTVGLATQPRVGMELPAYEPGSFTPTQPSLELAAAKTEAARCFRCDAIYRCESVRVQSGRGPRDGPGDGPPAGKTPPIQPPLAGPASNPPLTSGGRD